MSEPIAAVCVYCSSGPVDSDYLTLAADTGRAIAKGGMRLVSGGGNISMMGSLARAAREAGGHTIGIIPEHLMAKEVADLDADELVVTETMRERKRLMEDMADAFIALPGGIGTLEELFETWTGGFLGEHAKPVILVNYGGFYDPMITWLDDLRERGFVAQRALDRLIVVDSVTAAMRVLTDR